MQIEAVYQGGVFKPLSEVSLPENQHVRLSVEAIERSDIAAWLAEVQRLQRQIIDQRGYFPDSTADIATDRLRDE